MGTHGGWAPGPQAKAGQEGPGAGERLTMAQLSPHKQVQQGPQSSWSECPESTSVRWAVSSDPREEEGAGTHALGAKSCYHPGHQAEGAPPAWLGQPVRWEVGGCLGRLERPKALVAVGEGQGQGSLRLWVSGRPHPETGILASREQPLGLGAGALGADSQNLRGA